MFPWFIADRRDSIREALSFAVAVVVELGRQAIEEAIARAAGVPQLREQVRLLQNRADELETIVLGQAESRARARRRSFAS